MLTVYLAGEIHTNWRDEIIHLCAGLPITFLSPNTNHADSDDCGVRILGNEDNKFWHDHKGAKLNAIRIRKSIEKTDIVVVCFGEKYKQWNAAFDAGYATALNKSIMILQPPEHQHSLKEIDAAASVVAEQPAQIAHALRYIIDGSLPA